MGFYASLLPLLEATSFQLSRLQQQYLHSAAPGLHVIDNCIAAALIAKVPVREVLDALVEIPWRGDALPAEAPPKNGPTDLTDQEAPAPLLRGHSRQD
ncbi:hypothetical protein ACWIGF_27820 [Streptomyces diastaticus]